MSGFDNNPFVDPVDINPFQVRLLCCFIVYEPLFSCKVKTKRYAATITCLVGRWVWPQHFLGRNRPCRDTAVKYVFSFL